MLMINAGPNINIWKRSTHVTALYRLKKGNWMFLLADSVTYVAPARFIHEGYIQKKKLMAETGSLHQSERIVGSAAFF